MPFAVVANHRVFYRLEGKSGAPFVGLCHSIGTDHGMWAQQAEALLPYFQVLRYDIRGHGASDAPAGDYSIEQLGRDVIGLADSLGISKFSFCGLTRLVLAGTSPDFGDPANWERRRKAVLESGMAPTVETSMERSFSRETLARNFVQAAAVKSVMLGTNPIGYAGCCAALRDVDHTKLLRQIHVPTLVIVGDRDVATPWAGNGDVLAREIPEAQEVHLAAAHLSNLETPHSFNATLLQFLRATENLADSLDTGFAVRRAVLGDAHVDRAIAGTNEFTRDFQDLITRYAWGEIWSRPGLDQRTRRLLTLAITAALGRWEEFTLHVRAGLASELEACDLKEVLLQSAIYAGVPAANTAFHIADEEIAKLKDK